MSIFKKIIELFNGYLLALIIIQYLILRFYDYKLYKRNNNEYAAKQCKITADIEIVICLVLFIIQKIFI